MIPSLPLNTLRHSWYRSHPSFSRKFSISTSTLGQWTDTLISPWQSLLQVSTSRSTRALNKFSIIRDLFMYLGSMNETCYYRSYRDERGNLTAFYWKLLVVRLAFVVIFEVALFSIQPWRHLNDNTNDLLFPIQHFVFGVCRLIDALVPDIPKTLANKMKRERYMAKQILQDPEHHIRISDASCT